MGLLECSGCKVPRELSEAWQCSLRQHPSIISPTLLWKTALSLQPQPPAQPSYPGWPSSTKATDPTPLCKWATHLVSQQSKLQSEAKILPKCNLGFFCECTRAKPLCKSINTMKEALLRFTVFLFSGQTHFQESATGTFTIASKSLFLKH